MSVQDDLIALYERWQRENVQKRVAEQEYFRRYVARLNQVLYRKLAEDPKVLSRLPLNIQNAWRNIRYRSIGRETLESYLPILGEKYLAEARAGSDGSFEDFLSRILSRHESEEQLRQFLKS